MRLLFNQVVEEGFELGLVALVLLVPLQCERVEAEAFDSAVVATLEPVEDDFLAEVRFETMALVTHSFNLLNAPLEDLAPVKRETDRFEGHLAVWARVGIDADPILLALERRDT